LELYLIKFRMVIKNKNFLFLILYTTAVLCFMQKAAFACSCSPGSGGTIIGAEYVACGTNIADDDVVTYTVHNNILCSSSDFYKPPYYSNYTLRISPGGLANYLAANGTFRVFKTGSHILAISSSFRGEICGVQVTNYPFRVVHNDVITCCPHIFSPLGEETDDRDGDGVVDCIDNCPDDPNPDQGPCPDPLDTADTDDKEFGVDTNDCKTNRNQNFVADPINIFNGNLLERETDLLFNSPFKEGLIFERYYNSKSNIDSILGFGWTHNFNLRLFPNFNENMQLIKITGEKGRGYYFEDFDEDSVFKGAFLENSTIERDVDNNYIWKKDDGMVYKFDNTNNRLLSITDKNGNIQELTYNTQNLLETLTDNTSGRILTFHYNTGNKLEYISGPVTRAVPYGIWVSYIYDGNNNLIRIQYADDANGSNASGFEYYYEDSSDPNNMTSKNDLAGTLLSTWIYNDSDQAIANINTQGTSAAINYDDPKKIAVTDAYGITSVYDIAQIAGRKKITQTTKPGGCSSCSDGIYKTDFDDSGFPSRREYFNGRVDLYQDYDGNNNPETLIIAQGTDDEKIIFKTYHPDLSAPLTTTEKSLFSDASNPDREKITIYDYDDPSDPLNTDVPNEKPTFLIYRIIEKGFTINNLAGIIPYEYINLYSYNTHGQVIVVDGPLSGTSDTITLTYDAETKDLLTLTDPVTGSVILEHDEAGNITGIIDQNNIETTFSHDGRNRQITKLINGKISAQTFTAAGKLSTVTDRSEQITNYTYTSQGYLEKIIQSNGDYLLFDYDSNAKRIKESIYSAQEIQTFFKGYDFGDPVANPDLSPGKPWKSIIRNQDNTDNLETIYAYEHGNITQITMPDNLETVFEYDTLNRVIKSTKIKSNLDHEITVFHYDNHDNLIKIIDPQNHETNYLYDDLNRLVKTDSPDTGMIYYTYDESGNLITKNQNSRIINYNYDVLGRLAGIKYPDDPSENITLNYDQGLYGKGRLTELIDSTGSYRYSYNVFGYLTTEQKTISGTSFTTGYTYDEEGRPISIVYPSGTTVLYELNNTGRTAKISTSRDFVIQDIADNIDYQPFGAVNFLEYGNSKSLYAEFDLSYLTKNITVANSVDLSYFRSASGHIEFISENLNQDENQTFDYDDAYRLVDASGPFGENIYSYDKVGNRQTKTMDSVNQTYNYTFGTNQLEQITGLEVTNYTYNVNGSIESENSRQYFYNLNERLVKITDEGSTLGEYGYSYTGQRTYKTVNNITTLFHYDIDGNLIVETDQNGNVLKEYIYLEDQPHAMIIHGSEEYDPADIDQDGDVDGKDIAAAMLLVHFHR